MSSSEASIFGSSSPSSVMSEPTDNSSEKASGENSAPTSPTIAKVVPSVEEKSRELVSEVETITPVEPDQSTTTTEPQKPKPVKNETVNEPEKRAPEVKEPVTKAASPASARSPPTLEGLPHEVLVEICSRIRSKSQLKHLCLVSRKVQAAAVVPLYRSVSLDITKASKATAMMMSRENPGLDQIRELRLVYRSTSSTNNSEGNTEEEGDPGLLSAREVAMFMINGIPRDKLHCFVWESGIPLKTNLFSLLMKRQRRLKHVEVGAMGHEEGKDSLLEKLNENPALFGSVSAAESIIINPDCLKCANAARTMMEKSKTINRLALSAATLSEANTSYLNDDNTVSDPLFMATFSHLREPVVKQMRLTELVLEKIDMSHCRRTYCTVMDFESLKKLTVKDCIRADLFLDAVVNPGVGLPAQVTEFTISHTEGEGERFMISAVDRFLGFSKGLKALHIRIVNDGTLPGIGTILRHGETLEQLYVSIWRGGTEGGKYKSWSKKEDLNRLFRGLPKVRQLALPFHGLPPILDFHNDCDFKDIALDEMAHMPNLHTLNILNHSGVQIFELNLRMDTYKALCRTFATEIFWRFKRDQADAFATPKSPDTTTPNPDPKPTEDTPAKDTLRVIVFGESDQFPKYDAHLTGLQDIKELKRIHFLRGVGREHWNEADDTPMAVLIKEEELRALDLGTGLLEVDFGFGLKSNVS